MKTIFQKKQIAGIVMALFFLALIFVIPTSEILPVAARNTMCLALALISLMITEAFPIGIISLLAIPLLVLLGCVGSVSEALSGYTNSVLFFVLASFGISQALTDANLSKRLLVFLMKRFGKNSESLLFGIMLCSCLLSSIISNVASVAVFLPIIQDFLNVYQDKERKQSAKSYMIALPVASMIGGMMTLAGCGVSMLVVGIMEEQIGVTVSFVQWMAFGIPLAVVMLPVAWFLCIKIFPPAPLNEEDIQNYIKQTEIKRKMDVKEWYVLIVTVLMLVLWILSSWFPVFNITVVAILGLFLLMLPGIGTLTWKRYEESVSWQSFFLIGSMVSLGNAITSSGLGDFIAAVVFPSVSDIALPLAVGFIAAIVFLLLIPIPVSVALASILEIPIILFAQSAGINPAILIICMGLCIGNCYILPLDTVPFLTFQTKAYKMTDMPKVTAPLQILLVVLCMIWIPICAGFFGM